MPNKRKKTYLTKINYKKTTCPVCGQTGDFTELDYELICSVCSCVINNPYSYSAGKKLNTEFRFAQDILIPKED